MQPVEELGAVTYKHHYVSLKRLIWATLAITGVMGLLFFVVGFPPAFDTFTEKMYFHSIGIGLAALATSLVIVTFELEREPPLDIPLSYRAFGAVALAALGGLVFLFPAVSRALPHVGMLLFIGAFILIFDVSGALLIELLVLPRKWPEPTGPRATTPSSTWHGSCRSQSRIFTRLPADGARVLAPGDPSAKAGWIGAAATLFRSWGVDVVFWTHTGNGGQWWLDSLPQALNAFAVAGQDPYFG